MDNNQLIAEIVDVVTTVVGIVVASGLAYWIKGRETTRDADRREEERLRDWFEHYAVVEGVDPMLAEIMYAEHLYTASSLSDSSRTALCAEAVPIPFAAHTRVGSLLGTTALFTLSVAARAAAASPPPAADARRAIAGLVKARLALLRLRQYVLSTRIGAELEVNWIPGNERVISLAEMAVEAVEEVLGTSRPAGLVDAHAELIRGMAADRNVAPLVLRPPRKT